MKYFSSIFGFIFSWAFLLSAPALALHEYELTHHWQVKGIIVDINPHENLLVVKSSLSSNKRKYINILPDTNFAIFEPMRFLPASLGHFHVGEKIIMLGKKVRPKKSEYNARFITKLTGRVSPSLSYMPAYVPPAYYSPTYVTPPPPQPPQATTPSLLRWEDFSYEGSFRLPSGTFGGSNFAYGGTAPTYYPEHDSLFLVGHDWHQMVAEVKIPANLVKITRSDSLEGLPTTTVLQHFADATDGKRATADNSEVKVGGLLVYGQKLIGSLFSYYDGDQNQTATHFTSGLNLSASGDTAGLFNFDATKLGYVSGYMAPIPTEWQIALGGKALTGQCCIAIVSRTSFGPALFSFNPEDLGVKNPAPAKPLVYYPGNGYLGNWGEKNPYFNGTTVVRSVVWPGGTRSVLFFGQHGIGEFCYGIGSECNDPAHDAQGTHAYPYVAQVWAYDAADFAEVTAGRKQPWEVKPYALWNPVLPLQSSGIRGAAFDHVRRRLFILEGTRLDEVRPVVHAYQMR